MADMIFADGISVYKPREGRPDFIKGTISIDAVKLQQWLQTHPELRDDKGFVRLDIKESSKEGNPWYCSVDTYKPKQEAAKDGEPEVEIPW
jgi:hypothetical protein